MDNIKVALQQASIIKNEQADLANSAPRVGGLLELLARLVVGNYNEDSDYVVGQWCIYQGTLTEVVQGAGPGETPLTHPLKYSRKIVLDPLQITPNNPLPVSASALWAVLDELETIRNGDIPGATTETKGAARQATDLEYKNGAADVFTTPKQVKSDVKAFNDALGAITLKTLLDAADEEDALAVMTTLLNLTNSNIATKALLCQVISTCNYTPPTDPTDPTDPTTPTVPAVAVPNFIIFGHYIEKDPNFVRVSAPNSEWQGTIQATPNGLYRVTGSDTIGNEKKIYQLEEQLNDAATSWRTYRNGKGAAVYSTNVAVPGVSINPATGELDATGYNNANETIIQVNAAITGNVVGKSVKIVGNALTVLQGNYSFLKNNPPTTAPQLYFNVLLNRAANLEVNLEITDYSGAKVPNYAGFTAMTQNQTEALRRNGGLYNAPILGYVEVTIREVGKTEILLKIKLPKLPNANVNSTQFFPVNI